MFSKLLSATAVVLAATQLVSAQTYTECDPRKKSCPADPALGKENTVVVDFTQGKNSFFKAADGTTIIYGSKGAEFSMKKETEAPTVTSAKYIFFGKIDIEVEVAPGAGIVTSVVLQSDDRDEIDWEWIGSDTAQVQTNYFGKGDDSTFDRGGFSPVDQPQTTTHTYTIDWTKDYVQWIVDGTLVRELKYADAKSGTRFPQTPAQLKLGTWVAGSSTAPEGTVQWAGGLADFSKGPYTAYYKKVTIQDYAGGVSNAKQYVWADGSDGSWQTIKVETTDGSDGDSDETTTSTTAKPTTSKAASSTSSKDDEATTTGETKTKTTLTTVSTAASSSNADAGHNASQTSATPTESGVASQTSSSATTSSSSTATGAAFRPGFSGALVGAGVLAALAL